MAEPTQPARVLSISDLTPQVRQLILRPTQKPIPFQPGQWVSLKLPVGERPPLNRAYSMAAPVSPSGELALVFDRVPGGAGSGYLYGLNVGDELTVSGPHGHFVLPDVIDGELLLISRYTGIVPFRCMLKHLHANNSGPPTLLIAIAPSESELLYHQEFLTAAVRHSAFRYLPLVIPGGETTAVDHTLRMLGSLLDGQHRVTPMLCGTKGFVRPLKAYFLQAGFDRKAVKSESYD